MTEPDLLQQVRLAQQGDRQAFRTLVDHMMPRLYAVVFAICPNADEVYDILQDVCVKTWRALPKLRQPEAFSGWMMRIAVNTTRTRLSRRKEFPAEPDSAVFLSQAVSDQTLEHLAQAEVGELLQGALQQLSPEHREVVALVELEEMNCAEASRLLDCPAGTVRSRLFYARKQLKALLAPYRQALFQEEPRHD